MFILYLIISHQICYSQMLLHNLLVLLRGLCDFVLSEEISKIEFARDFGSVIYDEERITSTGRINILMK